MADTPGEGEAAQALFCAMADYVGVAKVKQVLNLEKYPTYASFKRENKKLIELLPFEDGDTLLSWERYERQSYRPTVAAFLEKLGYEVQLR
jgi:hypothetical protein